MKFALSGSFTPVAHLPELAIAADQTGWDMITLSDHTVNPETLTVPYPYTPDGSRRWPEFTDWPDQIVMMGAFASVTKRLRFTTNAFVLPARNPFLVAKAVSTAAVISDNRIVLTIGVGWSKDEFELLGQDFHTRGKRTDEMVEVMKLLWTGKYVEYHGKHYDFGRIEMNPPPTKPIPIWVGGISDAALRRAARYADGWLTDLQPAAEIVDCINKIRQYRKEYGREPNDFDVLATPMDVFDIDGYKRLEEQGVTRIMTQPWMIYSPGTKDLQLEKDAIHRYADDVISKFG
jgi:probable F420-dependent oxidoreductase